MQYITLLIKSYILLLGSEEKKSETVAIIINIHFVLKSFAFVTCLDVSTLNLIFVLYFKQSIIYKIAFSFYFLGLSSLVGI